MSPDDAKEPIADAPAATSGRKKLLTIGIVAGIMIVEAVGIFLAVRMTGEPPVAEGAEAAKSSEDILAQMDVELPLVDCDAINRKSGQGIVVHLSSSVRVAASDQERITKLIEKRQSTIKDRVQMVLRSADPQHLNEPTLDTLKRQIQSEVGQVLEDDEVILEVLITQILQSRSRL